LKIPFKGSALKNPGRGVAPAPHKPLKRLDLNFGVFGKVQSDEKKKDFHKFHKAVVKKWKSTKNKKAKISTNSTKLLWKSGKTESSEASVKSFCPTFFKKLADSKGGAFGRGSGTKSPNAENKDLIGEDKL